MYRVKQEFGPDTMEMRACYCKTLIELAEEDPGIVALDADLMSSMGMKPFKAAFPERAINCGVQEANMIGIAAGLSATGKVPFAHTFGPFATRRCFDQIFLSIAYPELNVRVVGSDPGITAAFNGGTHMPFEDYGIMRSIPGATIIEPVDCTMLKDILCQVAKLKGLFYLRLMRKVPVAIYEEGSTFEIGKGTTLLPGDDITIVATGYLVSAALEAARQLREQGISAGVVNTFTLKPFDDELIRSCAATTGALLTVENHNHINGLFSAVCESLAQGPHAVVDYISSGDRFGQVGPVDFLQREYGMTVEDIVAKAQVLISKKA